MRKIFTIAILAFSINAYAQLPSYVPPNGLKGFWPFTGNANDASGNSNNGTVNGATLTTDRFGNINSAYLFDGISNFIQATNINLPDSGTISVWVNPFLKAAGNNSWTYSASLVDKNTDANGNDGYAMYYNDSLGIGLYGQVGWSGNANNMVTPTTAQLMSLFQWQHSVFTFNNGTAKLYWNGNLIFTKTGVNSTGQSSQPVLFGKAPWASNGNLFKGKLDDVGIWSRALTSTEISALYNGGLCYQTITVTDTLIINAIITGFNPVTFQNSIKIFPNPTNDQITIDFGSNYSMMNGHTLKITNSLSQVVYTTPISSQQTTVNLSTWTGNGIYFVHLIDASNNTIDIRKIVLQ
jgi:hypothetical protein